MIEQKIEEVPDAGAQEPREKVYEKPFAELLVITPELAERLLDTNVRNRTKRDDAREAYSRDLMSGDWMLNGETIKIDWFDQVIDGQHRLKSCANTRIPFETFVVFGVSPEAQKTIDIGIPRTFLDELNMDGVEHGSTISSLTVRVFHWDPPFNERVNFYKKKVLPPQRRKVLKAHPELSYCAEVVEKLVGHKKLFLPKSTLAFIYWILIQQNPDEAQVFIRKVITGADVGENDPIMHLRDRLTRDAKKGRTRAFQTHGIWLAMSAWNNWMAGKQITKMQLPTGGIRQDNWPKLRKLKRDPKVVRPNFANEDGFED